MSLFLETTSLCGKSVVKDDERIPVKYSPVETLRRELINKRLISVRLDDKRTRNLAVMEAKNYMKIQKQREKHSERVRKIILDGKKKKIPPILQVAEQQPSCAAPQVDFSCINRLKIGRQRLGKNSTAINGVISLYKDCHESERKLQPLGKTEFKQFSNKKLEEIKSKAEIRYQNRQRDVKDLEIEFQSEAADEADRKTEISNKKLMKSISLFNKVINKRGLDELSEINPSDCGLKIEHPISVLSRLIKSDLEDELVEGLNRIDSTGFRKSDKLDTFLQIEQEAWHDTILRSWRHQEVLKHKRKIAQN